MNNPIYIVLLILFAFLFSKKKKKKKAEIIWHDDEAEFEFTDEKSDLPKLEDFRPYVEPIHKPKIVPIDVELFERENDKEFQPVSLSDKSRFIQVEQFTPTSVKTTLSIKPIIKKVKKEELFPLTGIKPFLPVNSQFELY